MAGWSWMLVRVLAQERHWFLLCSLSTRFLLSRADDDWLMSSELLHVIQLEHVCSDLSLKKVLYELPMILPYQTISILYMKACVWDLRPSLGLSFLASHTELNSSSKTSSRHFLWRMLHCFMMSAPKRRTLWRTWCWVSGDTMIECLLRRMSELCKERRKTTPYFTSLSLSINLITERSVW